MLSSSGSSWQEKYSVFQDHVLCLKALIHRQDDMAEKKTATGSSLK
jgi:hypothetical protein